MGNWQPIETAPRDGSWVLLVSDEGKRFVAHWGEIWSAGYEKRKGWKWGPRDSYFGEFSELRDTILLWHPLP